MKRYTMHALVVLDVALLGVLAWLWFDQNGQPRGVDWTPPVAIQPDFSGAPRSNSESSPASMALVLDTLERPLFSPNRRPPPPIVAASSTPEPPPDPLANVLIQGIFSGDGVGGIMARVDGVPRRISINETIGSWMLKNIDERNVTFVRKDETRVVQLQRAKEAPPPTLNTANAPAPSPQPAGPQALTAGNAATQAAQESVRDRYRRRNEARAKAGMPPVSLPE
ncbi:MAG: hypothetical protein Q7T97_11820 [Burkholderiaceae bacterium]|nr:hypothetical protein [Burkholderiaceae bacterium]